MSLKPHRNLDGIYFCIHEQDNTYDKICFSDLTAEEQDEMLENRSVEWLKSMIKLLARTIREIGDQFDLELVHSEENDGK